MNAYYNGVFGDMARLAVPLTDRSVFFGDGIYDACIGRNGKIFMPKEHTERFFRNARQMELDAPSEEEMLGIFDRLISENDCECFFLYFQLSRRGKARAHAYDSSEANFLVTLTEIPTPSAERRVKLIYTRDNRYELCSIKTVNLLPNVLAARKALLAGADEAVFVKDGIVTECAHSNIHIIKDGCLVTHPADSSILPGISRAHLLSVCRRLGVPISERKFTRAALAEADEVLITSTSKICLLAERVGRESYASRDDSTGKKVQLEMFSEFYTATV